MNFLETSFARRALGAFLLLVFILALAFGTTPAAFADSGLVTSTQYYVTNTSSTVPVHMAPRKGTYATSVTVIGNSLWQTTNTSTVYIGPNSTNDCQAIAVASGARVTITMTPNQFIDLYDWYLDVVTVNDGVCVLYTK